MTQRIFIAMAGLILVALAACQKPEPADDGFDVAVATSATPPPPAPASEAAASSHEWTGAPAPARPTRVTPIPVAFHGRWDISPDACRSNPEDPIEVSVQSIDYWEDSSLVRSLTVVGPGHIQMVTDDYGEETSDMKPGDSAYIGQSTWDLTLLDDGKAMRDARPDGRVITRIRCADVPPADDGAQ